MTRANAEKAAEHGADLTAGVLALMRRIYVEVENERRLDPFSRCPTCGAPLSPTAPPRTEEE